MELVLPNNYVALEEEEMMYLDEGDWIRDAAIAVVAGAVGAIVGHGVKHSLVGAAIRLAGGWVANTINALVISAWLNPGGAIAVVGGAAVVATAVYLTGKHYKFW
ncbi:argininosuccinate lyase [Streptococcus ruminantium]|uniref:argininosuccinate lyase n=1 Tax=Streptococcus ruminantium TaxID=1917441 RepID=UPI0012DF5C01|nr:argininosuccinate lyase [Streptococcus ruminantium]